MSWNDFRAAECGSDASPTFTPKKAAATKGLTTGRMQHEVPGRKEGQHSQGPDVERLPQGRVRRQRRRWRHRSSADEASYQADPEKATTVAPKGLKFPTKIAAKYADESAGKGRMFTCLHAYYVAKDANTLGGLKWIQKGGGFYSLCNDRLKS